MLVEAGCGVANAAIPLLKNENLSIFAFDFAPTAVRLVRETPEYNTSRLHAFVWDFCAVSLLDGVDATERGSLTVGGADLVSLIFVLSAVPPSLHVCGARHLLQLLKPGGRLLFRDYATGDLAETRFAPRNKIKDKYYVRQDSTLSYFFDEETLRCTMVEAGFQEVYVRRIHRVVRNRKEKLEMHRVFLQGEFIKANT